MDISGIIEKTELYIRQFILYILSFFSKNETAEQLDGEYEELNQAAIFSIMSAVFGAYLWDRFIAGTRFSDDLLLVVVRSLLVWISCGFLFYVVLRILRFSIPVIIPVLTVLRVFSISHFLAIYVAYVSYSTIDFLSSINPLWSVNIAYGVEILILWIYLPREIFRRPQFRDRKWSSWLALLAVLSVFTFIILGPLADAIDQQKEAVGIYSGEAKP